MQFQDAPTSFHSIVLAVIRRVIGQINIEASLTGEFYHSLYKLSTATMALRSIVKIDYQLGHFREASLVALPKRLDDIDETVACYLGGRMVNKKVRKFREENAYRRHQSGRVEVMIVGFHCCKAFAPA